MKNLNQWIWVVLAVSILIPATGIAETVYVSENFEITMRTGPGADRKIISLLESGQALEMVEKGAEWSMVSTPAGKEGWVLNRYLTADQPCAMVLSRMRQEFDVLQATYKDLKNRFDQLSARKKNTDADLSQSLKEREELTNAFETLRQEASEYLNLKKRHEKVTTDLAEERKRSAALDEENMQMKRNRIIQWVWTGGGIMLAGFFIGLFSSGRRKPRSSLY